MSVGQQVDVCGGVDTHRDVHMAVVVDSTGRVLGTAPFRADTAGYQQLGDWLGSHGRVVRVGIEGTGSYGAGLARYLTEAGVEVTEVNRPNRQLRRRLGKTDATDAQGAARAVLNGQATAVPKSGNGRVEAIRMLSVARRSATKARTQAINQLHALVVTAPDQVKHQLGGLSPKARVKACAGFRSRTATITVTYAKKALRSLARRYQALTAEIEELTTQINHLCAQVNPALLAASGVGADTAAALLVAAGDNPERMQSEASFAALCGEKSRPGVVGTDHTPPSQSGRQPPSQQCPVADRHHPHALRPDHHRLHPKKTNRRQKPPGDHPLPETAYRPPDLPPAHQSTRNSQRRPSSLSTQKRANNPHPRRHRPTNLPSTPLTTRARHLPQPSTRHPIPPMAHHPHTPPKLDLTTIGASSHPHHRHQPLPILSQNPGLHRQTHQRRQNHPRNPPLSQTVHRPTALPLILIGAPRPGRV